MPHVHPYWLVEYGFGSAIELVFGWALIVALALAIPTSAFLKFQGSSCVGSMGSMSGQAGRMTILEGLSIIGFGSASLEGTPLKARIEKPLKLGEEAALGED